MGIRENAQARIDARALTCEGITIDPDHDWIVSRKPVGRCRLAGARATVETSGQLERRVTATRLLATGVLAFGLRKKKDHRSLYLTIEGEDAAFVVAVDPKRETETRAFAAKVNTLAKGG